MFSSDSPFPIELRFRKSCDDPDFISFKEFTRKLEPEYVQQNIYLLRYLWITECNSTGKSLTVNSRDELSEIADEFNVEPGSVLTPTNQAYVSFSNATKTFNQATDGSMIDYWFSANQACSPVSYAEPLENFELDE